MLDLKTPVDPAIFLELSKETDRGVALIGSSLVEHAIARAIIAHMRPMGNDPIKRLFEGHGPLGTFSARIAIAFAFKICGPRSKGDLIRIKDIRNLFAHQPITGLSFEHDAIMPFCRKLTLIDTDGYPILPGVAARKPVSMRDRYLHTVSLFVTQLDGELLQHGLSSVLRK